MLNRAHAGHLEVLRGRRRTPEPAIIRDIDQQVGAIQNKASNFAREDRLVTDENAKSTAGQIPYRVASAAAKVTGQPCKIFREPEKIAPRHVFAEGNQMNFIILKFLAALRIEQGCTVIGSKPAIGVGFPANHAEKEVALRIARNFLCASRKIRMAQ